MKILVIIGFAFSMFSTSGLSQNDSTYNLTLAKFFEANGSEKTFETVINQMFEYYEQQFDYVSSDVWKELKNEFLKTSLNDLVDMLSPVYQKYLSESDLKEIISFSTKHLSVKSMQRMPI